MEELALSSVNHVNHAIETIATVVIPFEALLLIILRRRLFEGDILVNLLVGSTIRIFFYFFAWSIPFTALDFVAKWTPLHWEMSIPFIVAHILVGDLCFYLFHRIAHTRFFFLVDHSVHHSSHELNFSTNLRISLMSITYSWTPMLIPIALGFHPGLLFACFALANAVPFFMHNNYVGKLGWFEYVFNTPSHHRVHHGVNPQYIDKNFGGMLIIWDRLFGTYAEEVEPVRYGVVGMDATKNPFKVLLRGWGILGQSAFKKIKGYFPRKTLDDGS